MGRRKPGDVVSTVDVRWKDRVLAMHACRVSTCRVCTIRTEVLLTPRDPKVLTLGTTPPHALQRHVFRSRMPYNFGSFGNANGKNIKRLVDVWRVTRAL